MKFQTQSKWGAPFALIVTATLVTGCGGGGSSNATPPPVQNAAPTVSTLSAQTINQDTPTGALSFTVGDDGGADALLVAVSSTDMNLLPSRGLVLSGTGASRMLTVTPAEDATGTANVSVTATDVGGKFATVVFPVTVKAVTQSVAGYTSSTFALMENDTPVQVSGFTFVQDADDDATFAPLLQ